MIMASQYELRDPSVMWTDDWLVVVIFSRAHLATAMTLAVFDVHMLKISSDISF